MQFMRLGPAGQEIPTVRDDDGAVFDLRPITSDIDGGFFVADGIAATRHALSARALPVLEQADQLRMGAPIASPSAVLCIGQNYLAHAAESGDEAPEVPILFFKHPNTIVGPNDAILIPPGATKVDWEVELALVIGQRAAYLSSPEEALSHIAGVTVSNDVSERDYQLNQSGGQWSKGKSSATFNPLGPTLVPLDEIADVQQLRLWSTVNGSPRQDSSTADMIFSAAFLVWHLSQYLVLEPGDVVNTGTPQGVALSGRFPYLLPGDVLEVGIDGLGAHRSILR